MTASKSIAVYPIDDCIFAKHAQGRLGKERWDQHWGEAEAEPPVPSNIVEVVEEYDPKKEKSFLVLITRTVDRQLLTLRAFLERASKPLQGNPTGSWASDDPETQRCLDQPIESTYWTVMTAWPGHRQGEMQRLLNMGLCEFPSALETCVAIGMVSTRVIKDSTSEFLADFKCRDKVNLCVWDIYLNHEKSEYPRHGSYQLTCMKLSGLPSFFHIPISIAPSQPMPPSPAEEIEELSFDMFPLESAQTEEKELPKSPDPIPPKSVETEERELPKPTVPPSPPLGRPRSGTFPPGIGTLGERVSVLEERQQELQGIVDQIQFTLAEKEQLKAERVTLLNHKPEQVKCYYHVLLQELSSALMALFLLQNEVKLFDPSLGRLTAVARKQETSGVGDTAVGIASALKPALDLLPLLKEFVKSACEWIPLPGIASMIKGGIDEWQRYFDKKKVDHARNAFRGLTPKSLEKIADHIARKLALAYEPRLCLLKPEGAIRFAQCGVVRVIAALLNGQIEKPDDFVSRACWAVRTFKMDQNNFKLFDFYEIPLTKQNLEAFNERDEFLEDGLYRCSSKDIKTQQSNWNPEEDRLKLESLSLPETKK